MADDLVRFMHALFLPAARAVREVPWQPSTDVYRTRDGAWLIKFDLAGVRPEDMELAVAGSYLTVRGSRRDWCVGEECRHYLMEISYSQFERSIQLPCDLDRARITTERREGMLLVRILPEAAE